VSSPVATYAFLPWLRRGIGAEVSRIEGTGGPEPRTSVSVGVRFNSDDALAGGVDLELFGPGEVKGLDARVVIRTWPRAGVMDAEPNYFPLVELGQADLPWRFTAARATAGQRLTPWLALVVLADSEIEQLIPANGSGGLGRVRIKDAAVLPPSRQLWAWAHVQVTGETAVDEAKAAQLVSSGATSVLSRLVSPRRLRPGTAYRGLLVPSFKRGVLAGLGQQVPDAVDALEPAWQDPASGPLTLPVYFEWRFGTGITGDFEALARLLRPFEAPASVGIRDMDVSAPSPGLPAASPTPLGLEGMLVALGTQPTPWEEPARQNWVASVKPLLNLPAERLLNPGASRTVAPPLYGQWHAATDRCAADEPGALPVWFQDLSVDPRLRVGAGLGTRVVQEHQEALMASAWDQVDRVRQANEELRQAQLARQIALRLHGRHLIVPDAETVVMVTAPVHARVKASPTTVRALLESSPIPRGIAEGAFRRVARPLGPVGRRQGRVKDPARSGLLGRLNRGELSAAPVPKTPSGMATPERTGAGLLPASMTPEERARRRRLPRLYRLLALVLLLIAIVLGLVFGLWVLAAVAAGLAVASYVQAGRAARESADIDRRAALRDSTLTGDDVRAAPAAPGFVPMEAPLTGAPRTLPAASGEHPPSLELTEAFRESAARLFDRNRAPVEPLRVLTEVNLATLRSTLKEKLDPRMTIATSYRTRFRLDASVVWTPEDPIEPIMAAPEFPQPMYRDLGNLGSDWLLPGFSQIPKNTVTLLRTNQKMIEAYVVGLNHEMARELLWREYPTDQRGTYFFQFWDGAGFVPPPGQTVDPATLRDIVKIHTWAKPSSLGSHSPRTAPPGGEFLVFLVRGDLLRRYPNTVVYAARAKWTPEGLREIDDPAPGASDAEKAQKQSWPLFSGLIEPDATFFGFALTRTQVNGSPDPSGDPGWFFVLQEHSSEPRFGLDEADPVTLGQPVTGSNWDNLSWGGLVADAPALEALQTIDLDGDLPDTNGVFDPVTRRWHADRGRGEVGTRASDLAYITFQRPMRVGIHGADMVP
jgi:hypothetical protein